MVNKFVLVLGLLFGLIANSFPVRLFNSHIDTTSYKVAHVNGVITSRSVIPFMFEMIKTEKLPGDRIVIIDSPGGEVPAGDIMLRAIQDEQKRGVRIVCVVDGDAASMAFNILSQCDERFATKGSTFMFHHLFWAGFKPSERLTIATLKSMVANLEPYDIKYQNKNVSALRVSTSDYEKYAKAEKTWSVSELLKQRYLNAIVEISGFNIINTSPPSK